jgi:hypothetical protein
MGVSGFCPGGLCRRKREASHRLAELRLAAAACAGKNPSWGALR